MRQRVPAAAWPALRVRRSGERATRAQRAARQLRDAALNAALAPMCAKAPICAPLELLRAAPRPFTPAPSALAGLIARVSDDAERKFGACTAADAAAETYARLVHTRLAAPSVHLLAAIAKEAARDPVAERRSARLGSVMAEMRSLRVAPDAAFVRTCFDTAVKAADLNLVAALHNFALANDMCSWPSRAVLEQSKTFLNLLRTSALPGDPPEDDERQDGDQQLPRVVEYYNGVIQTALFTRKHQVAATALREMHRRGAGADADTIGLLAATHAELDDAAGALELVCGLQEAGVAVPGAAYAALVRCSGRGKNFSAARAWFDQHVRECEASGKGLTVSPATRAQPKETAVSARTLASAGDDVALAMFFAARVASDALGAVGFLEEMREVHGVHCSRLIVSIVVETCWRAGRTDLAKTVLAQLESTRTQQPEEQGWVGGWASGGTRSA